MLRETTCGTAEGRTGTAWKARGCSRTRAEAVVVEAEAVPAVAAVAIAVAAPVRTEPAPQL